MRRRRTADEEGGKGERRKIDSYYTGVEFYHQFLKALTTGKAGNP